MAIFIEYVHAASLVIDDLPEFDNDLLRRGAPSLHAAVGPAVAQLAALSLISAAIQNVCRQIDWLNANAPEIRNADRIGVRICGLVSRTLGAAGAAGGQFMDIGSTEDRKKFAEDATEELMALKTASLFELAVVVGWLVAGGEFGKIDDCLLIGRKFGLAFQIADDIGDMAKDAARATAARPDPNYANRYGRDIAEIDIKRHLDGAALLLVRHGLWSPLWADEIFPAVHAMKNST